MSVRKSPPPASQALTKRARVDDEDEDMSDAKEGTIMAVTSSTGVMGKGEVVARVKRTSGLEAPIVSLAGAHTAGKLTLFTDLTVKGEITSCRFNPTGELIAAGSVDRCISLWHTYPPHDNFGFLPHVHKSAVLDVRWSLESPDILWSVGADGMLIASDTKSGERLIRYPAHYGPANAVSVTNASGRELVLTGGDDGVARVWDPSIEDSKEPIAEFDDGLDGVVTAVEWSADGNQAFVGGIDNEIKVWDLRKKEIVMVLKGHQDTIASLALSPNGHYLLSYSFDSTCIIHDVRPFSADPTRVWRTLQGAPSGFEQNLISCAWTRHNDGAQVAAGGGDRSVTIWDVSTSKIQYKLGGHKGTVGAVDFHPREPIVLTGSVDKNMLLGEIETQDYS